MVKTIIFDLGGVYFSDGTKNAIRVISEKYNLPEESVRNVLKGDLGTQYRVGALTTDEFWNQAKKSWNVDVSNEELSAVWLEGYKPITGMKELLNELKDSGYKLLFLSDNVEERVKYLEENYHFMENFTDGVFSHLAKIRKPNPEIYKIVLEKASHGASECVYIDDKIELLNPAKELGMEIIAFRDAEQLKSNLREIGIKFKELENILELKNITK